MLWWIGLERYARLALSFAFLSFVARRYSEEQLGMAMFLVNSYLILSVVSSLGAELVSQLRVQTGLGKLAFLDAISQLSKTRVIGAICCFPFLVLTIVFGIGISFLQGALYTLALSFVAVSNLGDLFDLRYVSTGAYREILMTRGSSLAISTFAKFALVLFNCHGAWLFLLLLLDQILPSLIYIQRSGIPFALYMRRTYRSRILGMRLEFASSLVAVAQSKLDVLACTLFIGLEAGAVYSVGGRVADAFNSLAGSANAIYMARLLPKRSASISDFSLRLRRWFTTMLIGGLLAGVSACTVGPYVFRVVFGEEYAFSAYIAGVLLLSAGFGQVLVSWSKVLLIDNRYKERLARLAVGLIVTIALMFGAVARDSDIFIAIAVLSGQFAAFVLACLLEKSRSQTVARRLNCF